MSINKRGFWESGSNVENYGKRTNTAHCYDKDLASALLKFFQDEDVLSVADFGCGLGDYTKFLNTNNLNTKGFDGNPDTPKLTDNLCSVMDLSKPNKLEEKFDWVLCLEVGEHIPKEYESILIKNIDDNNTKGVILSWAVVGQGGHGHVNCQDNEYIKEAFSSLNYTNDEYSEFTLRSHATLPWFKNTIMVFRK